MKNAQKISNLCYPRGSVVYAKFDKNSEYYYLNMRPLIVVSQQTQMFDSLTVIGCGSRDRPGIEISLFNHQAGHWIGNHQFSVAQPYAIFSIIVPQIIEFHGVIDPWTMDAIDKAMAFHLGLSKEVPPYMTGIYDEIMKPTYSMGTEDNTQLKDPHQFGGVNETTRKFVKLPSKVKPDLGKAYPKKNTPRPLRPNTNTVESVKKNLKPKATKIEEPKTETTEHVPEEQTITNTTNPNTPTRVGKANLYIPKEDDCLTFDDSILAIANSLTDVERVMLITRKLEPGKNMGKSGLVTIWANQIPQIRKAVEYTYGLYNGSFATKMASRICHQQRNFRFLSDWEKTCAIMYGDPKTLEISETIYNEVAKQLIKEKHLDFSDGRPWRAFPNLEQMKKVYTMIKK